MDEKLIRLVREKPELFDKRRSDYRDAGKKRKAWAEIAQKMGLAAAECKKRWRALRDRYVRTKRSEKKLTGTNKCPPALQWELLSSLSFLGDFVNHRMDASNVVISQEAHDDTNNEDSQVYHSPQVEMNVVGEIDLTMLAQPATQLTIPDGSPSSPTSSVCTTRSSTTIQSNKSAAQSNFWNVEWTPGPTQQQHDRKRTNNNTHTSMDVFEDTVLKALKTPRLEEEAFGDLIAAKLKRFSSKRRTAIMLRVLEVFASEEKNMAEKSKTQHH